MKNLQLNQVKSLLSGLSQVEQQLSRMIITTKHGHTVNNSDHEGLNEMKRKIKMLFDEKPEAKFAKLTLSNKDSEAEEKQIKVYI